MTKNLFWHEQSVSYKSRISIKGHGSAVLWFTGLSGSGKSTIANKLDLELNKKNIHTYLLDGDNVRQGLNKNLGFSEEDRVENIRRIGEVSKLFVDAGIVTLTAFISPFKNDRKSVRELFPKKKFIEIACSANLKICEERDPKGLYQKALSGQIPNFTGVGSDYEKPQYPEIILNTNKLSVEKAVNKVMVIARVESLILGKSMEDALKRSEKYVEAGADGIMIHSKDNSASKVLKFAEKFKKNYQNIPLVAVPSSYNSIREKQLENSGFNILIYANHMLRASYPAMKKTAENILKSLIQEQHHIIHRLRCSICIGLNPCVGSCAIVALLYPTACVRRYRRISPHGRLIDGPRECGELIQYECVCF